MIIPYATIGKVAVYFAAANVILILAALAIGFYSFKKRKILFPGFTLFILDLFYAPVKWICIVFSIRQTLVDEIMIEIQNAVLLDKYKAVKKGRIVIGPHCMRHPKCPARCDPRTGYQCRKCGLCDFAKIKEECEKNNMKLYIVPGSSFVKKIIRLDKPKATLGIACFLDLNEMMRLLFHRIPLQGVPLIKDGCFDTKVCVDDVIEKIRL